MGNLNLKYNLNRNLSLLLKNIDNVLYNLSLNKNPLLIYTSSIYQKISILNKYKTDRSRVNYGYTKTIIGNILKYLCNKYRIKYIDFELQNPIGLYEKEVSLPSYLASVFFSKSKIELHNPERQFKFQFIEKIANDYYKSILKRKKVRSIYFKTSVNNFKNIFFNNFKRLQSKKKFTTPWGKYYKYYKKVYENKKN